MDRLHEAEALRAAALAVSAAAGDAVFGELVQFLARLLGADAATIAVFTDAERSRMRALATWLDGRLVKPFEYELAHTPCAGVVGREFRYAGRGAGREFAPGTLFGRNGMDAYAAYSLNAPDGAQLGLIAVMARAALPEAALVEPMLKIFAVRAVAEVERLRAGAALKVSEASYRAIFEAAEDALFVLDWESGAIRDVNPKACAAYGYTREEMLELGARELSSGAPPYTHEAAARYIAQAKAGAPVRFEWHRRNKDGSLRWDEVTLKAATIAGERRLLAFVRDITERKGADEALAASEAQYRSIFEASTDALVLWDSRLRRVDVNPAFERMYGWTRDEVLGQAYEALGVPAGYAEQRLALVRRSLAGETCRVEFESARKSGERFRAEITTIPFTHRGEPHVLAIARDVTARRTEEELLRASEEQYRAIFNAAADALILRDESFRIVDVNPAYEAMSGYSRAEVLGRDHVVANPPELDAEIKGLHRRALAGEPVMLETVRVRKDGARHEVELRGVPIRHRGAPHVLWIGRDLSERRALEARLRQAQKMEAFGQLTGGMAHDFNNLLASIMGYVVLASERVGESDAKLAAQLEQALASCRRARDLIGQMLTFSRGQRGQPRALPLVAAVEQSLAMLRGTLPATLELHASLQAAPPALHDPVQIGQVLMNLLINARDATAAAGRVDIGLRATQLPAKVVCASCGKRFRGDFVELAVADSGPGIPPPVLERMFEPFFTTKEVGRGSGMGLAMVHGIVHEHGGHVLVESAPGEGSRFRVLLPALADGAASGPSPAPAARRAPRARLSGRVLVVDDDATVAEFMRELLESWGLAASALTSPAGLVERFSREPQAYDLVILDHTMPGTTGVALARQLVALRPGLPILLYTGHSDRIVRDELEAAGIRALLHKPVEPDQLHGLLATHLH